MGNNASNKPSKPAVGKQSLALCDMLTDFLFPANDYYDGSKWGKWVERVKKGHMDDEEEIEDFRESMSLEQRNDTEMGNLLAQQRMQMEVLTNNMYATLIVSLWSMLEAFLNLVLGCNKAHGNQKKAPPKTLYGIKDIQDAIDKAFKVDIENCKQFDVINAVRILNNCYKHNNGRYKSNTDSKKIDQINQSLIERWEIPDAPKEIIYSALPMHEIVGACNIFCHDLCDNISIALDKIEEKNH